MALFFGLTSLGFFFGRETAKETTGIPLNYVSKSTFSRSDLISKVSKGDGNAAYELGQHYEFSDLPEAAHYWFGIALKLGNKKVDRSFLDFYEHTIIGQYDAGPYDKSPSKITGFQRNPRCRAYMPTPPDAPRSGAPNTTEIRPDK